MADNFSVKIEGAVELKRLLAELPAAPTRRALRAAVSVGATPALERARALVPVETGLLKKSLGRRLKVYPASGNVVAIIGPRSGFKREVTRKKGRRKPRKELANPVKYAHLVELGFHAPSGRFVPPKSFLRAAIHQTREQSVNATAKKFEEEILKEAGKLVLKHYVKTGQLKV